MTLNAVASRRGPAAPPPGDPKTALDAMNSYLEPAPRREMATQWAKLDELMAWMTYRRDDGSSATEKALALAIGTWLKKWMFVSIAALCATLAALVLPGYRFVAAIGVFWFGMGVAHSMLGLAGERYMLVTEPLLYILIAVVAGGLLLRRPVFGGRHSQPH